LRSRAHAPEESEEADAAHERIRLLNTWEEDLSDGRTADVREAVGGNYRRNNAWHIDRHTQ
jgi:hypothetical protein